MFYVIIIYMALLHCVELFEDELFQTVPERITSHGYPVEVHHVTTADGYILELHRIPRGRTGPRGGRPVMVMHGVLDTSAAFVINPRRSLAFMLADQGYDVWLANSRGNRYSRRHVTLDPEDSQFWDFTGDDQGQFDNPAMIDYILQATGNTDLDYIGFSLGACSFWRMMNFDPSYNNKVRLMVGLAPASTRRFTRNPFRVLAPIRDLLSGITQQLGSGEILPHKKLYGILAKIFCSKHSPTVVFCALGMFALAGWDPKQLDKSILPMVFANVPAGTGAKVLEQTAQSIEASGNFQRFDYGREKNLYIYGQPTPPQYSLELVTTPVVLLWGKNDNIVDQRDVAKLADGLPNLVSSEPVRWPLWQHFDFMWGIDADRLVYARVLHHLSLFGGHRRDAGQIRRTPRTPCAGPSVVGSPCGTMLNETSSVP